MKQLSREAQRAIEAWLARRARPLEWARYQVLFHGAPAENYLSLLKQYQNPDGGFGHAIEPDNWNPASTPVGTATAMQQLAFTGLRDFSHPLWQGALRYLESGADFSDGFWHFTVPSNNAYPHAPWWTHDPAAGREQDFGASATLAAYVLRMRPENEAALAVAREALSRLQSGAEVRGEMTLGGFAALCPLWERLGWAGQDETLPLVKAVIDRSIARDPAQWTGYVARPSSAIFGPDSPFYPGNEAIVETELDYLIDTLPQDDVWPLTWEWFGMPYPNEWAIAKNWWKGVAAIEKLLFLRAFGRLA